MTADTVTGEVARVQAPGELINTALVEFARVLPADVSRERFGQWALTMMSKALASPDDRQRQAWEKVLAPANTAGHMSVLSALKECAALGLEPGREYHLVPFGATVTGVTDYKGEVRLISNWEPCAVVAMLVREADKFHMTGANIPPTHDADWFADRGPVIGGYSYVDYGQGRYSLVYRLPESSPDPLADSFLKHREVAKTKAVWDAWGEQMRLKTLVHGTRKTVPWSAERKW
jgi:recombinational DNA repair protein RecT